ncbi:dicarboxylate/amino acid:cation symporter [Rariglobus hedericola]|uniref:Dicarboxylate/amino acid:cation symporter n=1 Tax=Rariglobus hedericola TaxID=2597822 RepID=A0A556QL92_9BACT|nr:dicarboxylate/amino acid:cation symporter [Rariglobus hedericola]TSJ77391.1 dicarboxylate/amino acid:cation symporter [Rariglobus hedericola]
MSASSAKLANRILGGLVVGLIAGLITIAVGRAFPEFLSGAQWVSKEIFDPAGQIFLRLLFFVIIPLVFASLAVGVVQLGRLDKLGPLAGKTFGLFLLNMVIGVALALVMMDVVKPGHALSVEKREELRSSYTSDISQHIETREKQQAVTLSTIVEMFMPKNLLGAVTGQTRGSIGEVLPLILFALLVGAVGVGLADAKRAQLISSLELVNELMTGIVHYALRLAPYAVPLMIYSVVVRTGIEILLALGLFVTGVLGVLALHLFGTMSLWLKFMTKRSPLAFFKIVKPVLITAFSTSSSAATMAASIAVCKEELKVSPSVSGFVIPLGATMNMSGTALYEGCVVLFVAQVFGPDLAIGQQMVLLLLSVLSAVAVAGIPGGSLPLIAGLCMTFGIPPEGIAIILGVDRLLDMARTTVNVGADLVTAVIVNDSMPPESEGLEPVHERAQT